MTTLCLEVNLALLQHEVLAHDPLPDILDIFHDGLEVRRRVVRTSDEDVIFGAWCCRRVKRGNGDKPNEQPLVLR